MCDKCGDAHENSSPEKLKGLAEIIQKATEGCMQRLIDNGRIIGEMPKEELTPEKLRDFFVSQSSSIFNYMKMISDIVHDD